MCISFIGCDIFSACFHIFIPKHKSYCAGDVFHHWLHCLHYLILHNTLVAAAHGNCDCDDGDGDDAGCDAVVVFVSVVLVPCQELLPVLPANTKFHLTVM